MDTSLDTPEPNEGLVTYTYDDYDRLLYRNVYQTDIKTQRSRFSSGSTLNSNTDFKPKKLLYQDVYDYNNLGQSTVKRVYQPVIEFVSAVRDSSTSAIIILTANITCKSQVVASGFVSTTVSKEALLGAFLTPNTTSGNDLYDTASFRGENAVGTIVHTITQSPAAEIIWIKAYAVVATGTLFSKTIEVPV